MPLSYHISTKNINKVLEQDGFTKPQISIITKSFGNLNVNTIAAPIEIPCNLILFEIYVISLTRFQRNFNNFQRSLSFNMFIFERKLKFLNDLDVIPYKLFKPLLHLNDSRAIFNYVSRLCNLAVWI